MDKLKKYRIKDIDWTALIGSLSFQIPYKVTVDVVDLSNPSSTPVQTEVTVVNMADMRDFLIGHYDWAFLDTEFNPEQTSEDRFETIWNHFVDHKSEGIARAVAAWMAKYRPGSAFYRRDHGDTDKISYNSTVVNNGGSKSSSYSAAGGSVTVTIGTGDTDGYRSITPGDVSVSASELPTTTTRVTSYDSTTENDSSETENKGRNGSINGMTSSGKTNRTGDDTHSKDVVSEGTEMGKGLAQAISDEIGMRLTVDIGYQLLDEFAKRYLIGNSIEEE